MAALERSGLRFDDFRSNGLLLPSTERAARRTALPLHRGPHRRYNELVAERVGRIELHWRRQSGYAARAALWDAAERVGLLQAALRRLLIASDRHAQFALNRRDPWLAAEAYETLDAMADALWTATG